MTTYARIASGIVAEMVEIGAGEAPLAERYHPDLLPEFVELTGDQAQRIAPGWSYANGQFAEASPPPAVQTVPASVSRAQALDTMAGFILPDGRALDTALTADLQAALDALADRPDSDPEKIEAKRSVIWFANAQTFEREHPRLLAMATQYDLSSEQIDALFLAAASA